MEDNVKLLGYKDKYNMDSVYPYIYKDMSDNCNILLIDKSDFDINNHIESKIEYNCLSSVYRPFTYHWDKLKNIDEILKMGLHKEALTLALTIPDICSKINRQPDSEKEDDCKRYKEWYDKYINYFDIGELGKDGKHFDCFNGYMCYLLRCHMVHGDKNDIADIPNRPESTFIKNYNFDKVYFCFSNKEYSESFVISNNEHRYIIFFKSIYQLIYSIIRVADKIYTETENKSWFNDGCILYKYSAFEEMKF